MGPSVKFVLAIIDSISKTKMGVNFFPAKLDTKGGGSKGFVSVATKFTCSNPTPRIQLSVRPFIRPFVPIFYMHHTYMHQDEGS